MEPERWQQIEDLFHAVLAHSPPERPEFLDHACPGDAALREEVESLVAAYDHADSTISHPAVELAAPIITEGDQADPVMHSLPGRYRVLSLLGSGGMGDVYLAEDTRLGRKVALKVLPGFVTGDRQRVRRFQLEARATSALNHPNIITIYEVGEAEDVHYIAAEYIEGETLRRRLQSGRLPLDKTLNIAIQIGSALEAAHEAGIAHRDIKPENIMLRTDGYVKVLDFGLAKLTEQRTDDTQTPSITQTEPGIVRGTVQYMSPEQARGLPVDVRTDIFSFGVVLYEMVTGRTPFAGATKSDVIAAVLDREPEPLAHYVAHVPAHLERIVRKALQKNRGDRYQSIKELLLDLRRLEHRLEFDAPLELSKPPEASAVDTTNEDQATDGVRVASATRGGVLTAAAGHLNSMRPRAGRGRLAGIALVAIVVAAIPLAYIFYSPKTVGAIDSIAVLPLVNGGNDPETEYLSDGITESLINSLSQYPQLRVAARTTAFQYKRKEIDARQVGRELGVGAVLIGRFVQRGDTLIIQVELVETSKGSLIWGKKYNRKASELLAVRQELARAITERLRLRLMGEDQRRLTRGDAVNSDAYRAYLKGRYFWNGRSGENLKLAIEYFRLATERDPNYALAYVGLADCYGLLERYAGAPSSETLPKARAAVERALQIDGSLAEAHTSLAWIELNSWNVSEAEREYKRAIELDQNYATAHFWYSFYFRWMGRSDEAMAEAKRARQLDPLSPVIGINVAQIHEQKGELDEAIEAAKKVFELDPNFAEAHRTLGVLSRRQGRYDEAIAESEKAVELSGRQSFDLADLGVCYAAAGNRAAAQALLKELEEKYHKSEALGQNVADVCAALGDKEQALAWLEKDFQARSGFLLGIAYGPHNDTLRDALSSDPRWNDLLRGMGLSPD